MLTQNYLQNKQKTKQQNCKHTKNTQEKKTLENFIGETIELFMSLSKFSK